MSLSASYDFGLSVRETPTVGVDAVSNPIVTYSFAAADRLNATSTPVATKQYADTVALTAGAATIDLTAMTGFGGAAITFSGLKVQLFKFRNNGANAMTIGEGASNGYEMLGNAWSIVVPPGGIVMLYMPESAPDVGGSAKTIDVAGTLVQEFDVHIVAG